MKVKRISYTHEKLKLCLSKFNTVVLIICTSKLQSLSYVLYQSHVVRTGEMLVTSNQNK